MGTNLTKELDSKEYQGQVERFQILVYTFVLVKTFLHQYLFWYT